jgi:hypothetical protein
MTLHISAIATALKVFGIPKEEPSSAGPESRTYNRICHLGNDELLLGFLVNHL